MSDIGAHYTQIAKTTAGAAQGTAALKGGTGVFGMGAGAAFWDLILGQIGNTQTKAATREAGAEPVAADVAVTVDEDALLAEGELEYVLDESLLALLGEKPADDEGKPLSLFDVVALIQDKDGALPLSDEDTLQKQIDLYQKLVGHLTAGLPLESKDQAALDAMVARLQKQTDILRTGKLDGEDVPLALLIAMGVSPAQLTQIGEKISKLEEKLGREITVEDIIAGVGNIVEPKKPDETTKVAAPAFGRQNIPASLDKTPATAAPEFSAERARYQRGGEQLADYQPVKSAPANDAGPAKIAAHAAPSFAATLATISTGGDMTLPQNWQAAFIENITATDFDIHTGLPFTQAAQATHMATAVAQAGHTHPATQLVSLTLNKMAKAGDTSEMTIQMDPPELGRVIAKMQFGKDKTVKAVLMVEKPETYTMLIRDAASLERALQDAGLTMDSASLSFELAQDGSAFNSDNDGKGGGEPSGKNGTELAMDEQVIETTMSWQVDPDTGYIRYNLLA